MPAVSGLFKSWFPDPVAAEAAKVQMQQVINQALEDKLQANTQELEAKAKIITAEAAGDSYESGWRPTLMYLFMIIIANNYVVFPMLHVVFPSISILPVPEQMWTLINICVGGYVGGRSLEKIATTVFDNTKFFASLKKKMGTLTTAQEDALSSAIKDAESNNTNNN